MRVTNKMMADNVTNYLFKQTERMNKTQEQIVTGKTINRPSDDPTGINRALSYRETISSLGQYEENMANGKLHIDAVDNILDIVTNLLREAKDVAFDTAPDMRTQMASDVAAIRDQVLQLANHQIDGRYAFSGDSTTTAPYNSTTWLYNGDTGTKDVMIGEGITVNAVANGTSIFGPDGSNVFNILNDLETALLAPNPANIEAQITRLESATDRIDSVRAQNASTYKRLEATENYYSFFKVNVEDMLSKTEDANMAEVIINFQVQQTTYESTLASSSMILQRSLIDFLR